MDKGFPRQTRISYRYVVGGGGHGIEAVNYELLASELSAYRCPNIKGFSNPTRLLSLY